LVGCNHILSGAFWWWWWSKRSWDTKSHFAYDLVYVRKFQLCLLPIWKWWRIWGGGFGQSCSAWVCLGWDEKVWQSLEVERREPGAQSGHQTKNGISDHIACDLEFEFDFGLNWVGLNPKVLVSV
jgi:hypothetical protein